MQENKLLAQTRRWQNIFIAQRFYNIENGDGINKVAFRRNFPALEKLFAFCHYQVINFLIMPVVTTVANSPFKLASEIS